MTISNWLSHRLSDRRKKLRDIKLCDRLLKQLPLTDLQKRGVRRGMLSIRRWGGVLLADDVGLGKTRMAVHLAKIAIRRLDLADRILLTAPARLLDQWRSRFKGQQLESLSHYSLSTHQLEDLESDHSILIVDEAHRFCNPDTNRYRALKETAGIPIILLTATPIRNHIDDLYWLLRLFLSERATLPFCGLRLEDLFDKGQFDILRRVLKRFIIRRTHHTVVNSKLDVPRLEFEKLTYTAGPNEKWLWSNLRGTLKELTLSNMPEWSRGLFRRYVLRRWESSPSALLETVNSLVRYHRAWLNADAHDRELTRSRLKQASHSTNQKVFPFIWPEQNRKSPNRDSVKQEIESLKTIRRHLENIETESRFEKITEFIRKTDEKLLILTQYKETALELFRFAHRQHPRLPIGLITGTKTKATGLGITNEKEILFRFKSSPDRGQSIRILIGTDCLSTGKNLQVSRHLIMLDLPESPLKLRQRFGRIARPGNQYGEVTAYLPRPESWEDPLNLMSRLQQKATKAKESGIELLGHNRTESNRLSSSFSFSTQLDELALGGEEISNPRDSQRLVSTPAKTFDPQKALVQFDISVRQESFKSWELIGPDQRVNSNEQLLETLRDVEDNHHTLLNVTESDLPAFIRNRLTYLQAGALSPAKPSNQIRQKLAEKEPSLKQQRTWLRSHSMRLEKYLARKAFDSIPEDKEPPFEPFLYPDISIGGILLL